MRRKYLFFDIDGTLAAGGYGNTYIPDSTKLALEKLREAGHFLAIATGRSQAMAEGYLEELGFENMVSDGGYGITIEGKVVEIRPLPKQDVVRVIDECKQRNIPWALQVDNTVFRSAPDNRFEEFTHDVYMQTRVVEGLDPNDYDNIYKAYIACYPPTEHTLESLKNISWGRFHNEYIFVEPTDKAYGIRRIMEHFGADCSDVVVFGDAANDLSMFVDGWIKVAMGNAIPELKERADYITTDVDKDGIYNACVALSLIEP